MLDRISPRALFLIALAVPFAGCSNPLVDEIAISPTTQSIAVGQTAQFTAVGLTGHGNSHPGTVSNITDQVTWSSSVPSVATINTSGVATGVSAGSTTITATINGYTGLLGATATLTVTGGSGVGTLSGITSLTIIPGSQAVPAPGETAQFIAIGTTSTGATIDITDQVTWSSASVQIATINPLTGLATAVGQGSDTITALYTNPGGGSTITGTATFSVTAGTTEQYTAVTIVPNSQEVTASGGQTGQFIALGTLGSNGLEADVTNSSQITWVSSIPTIATVTSGLASGNGVATGVSQGSTTITAELRNPDGSLVSNTASVTVTLTPAPEPLLSLTIIPSSITVGNLQDSAQFLAIGTYSTPPTVRDLTNSVTWISATPGIFPVNTNGTGTPNPADPAGVVTAYGSGNGVIIAEATGPAIGTTAGSIQTATATFNCPLILPTATTAGSCYPGSEAPYLTEDLTIYNEGANTTDWLVTASSATGTPDVIHCGPGSNGAGLGGSVCVASYPEGTEVVLTAPAGAGAFGGWSYNCTPSNSTGTPLTAPPYFTAAGPNYCVVFTTFNTSVAAIFN
jgi:uncharacterized protein YjdB